MWRVMIWYCAIVSISAYSYPVTMTLAPTRLFKGPVNVLAFAGGFPAKNVLWPLVLHENGVRRVRVEACIVRQASDTGDSSAADQGFEADQGYTAECMLLEAKQQISHLGDTENIAQYVRMLQIAKEALIGVLQNSGGRKSSISLSLIRELSQVNPLSQPARDQLLARKYRCLSSYDVENTRFRCNALVHFSGGALADALDAGNVDKKKKKTRDFGGRVVVELPGGGGERLEGAWASSGKDKVSVTWDGSAGEELNVLYLDRDLVILQVASSPWVFQVAS